MPPLKRNVLKGISREQWDPMHPGPLAYQIKPTHVDTDLIRYEVFEQTSKKIKAWVLIPSDNQKEIGCDFCPKKHSDKNKKCSANNLKKLKRHRYSLFNIKTQEKLGGRWVVTTWLVKDGYKSGYAEINKL